MTRSDQQQQQQQQRWRLQQQPAASRAVELATPCTPVRDAKHYVRGVISSSSSSGGGGGGCNRMWHQQRVSGTACLMVSEAASCADSLRWQLQNCMASAENAAAAVAS
jgi:hypothetical protein